MKVTILLPIALFFTTDGLRCYQCISSKTSSTGSCVHVEVPDEAECPSYSRFCAKSNMSVQLTPGSIYDGLGAGVRYIMMRHCARSQDICPNNRPCRLTDIGDFTHLGKKFAHEVLAKLLSSYQKVAGRDDDEIFGKECPRLDQFEISNWHSNKCDKYLCNNDPGYTIPSVNAGVFPNAATMERILSSLFILSTSNKVNFL